MTNITFTRQLESLMRKLDSEGIVYNYHQSLLTTGDNELDKSTLALVKDARLASLCFEIPLPSSVNESEPFRYSCYVFWLGKGRTAYKPIFRYSPCSLGKAVESTEYLEILNTLSDLIPHLKREQAKLAFYN